MAKTKKCPKKGCPRTFRKKARYLIHLRRDHGLMETW